MWGFYNHRLTKAGRWFLFPVITFGAIGAASLDLQGYVPFVYSFALWVVALLSMWLFRPGVTLKARHAGRICAGEILPVEVEVEQQGRLAASDLFVLADRLPPGVDAVEEEGSPLPVMLPGEKARVKLGLRCTRRGAYRLKGFRVETDFPLGLLRANRVFHEERPLLVYPQFTPLLELTIPMGRRYHPGGVALASSLGDSFEYLGNREYREGDNIRDIDWRATARLNKPVIREYREEYFLRVAVILDTHVPRTAGRGARQAFERAVSHCAAVSDYLSRQDYLVDILAAGPNLYHLTTGRSLAYQDQVLDILACVEENPVEPFTIIEPEILENLSRITAVVCIFLDWNEARQEFIEKLEREGAGLKVIIIRDTPCTLDPGVLGQLGAAKDSIE